MFAMQLTLDAADRLVAVLTERQEPLALAEAARLLVAAARVPADLQRRLLDEAIRGDARLAWRSSAEIALAAWAPVERPIADAAFCVLDLETTGTRASTDRIVEIGAVLVVSYELGARFERLVDPGLPLPVEITRLTGIRPGDVEGRTGIGPALRAFLAFAGDAVLVAHNARFDIGFLDAELQRARGRRLAGTVLDTVGLARRLLPGRRRYSLGALAERYSTDTTPCHRALPDALATAEILLVLLGKAQEAGATTIDDLVQLSVAPARRAHGRRALAEAAPRAPGTYVMRDARDRPLYVGTATDLRARTLSYFRGVATPRPVERVLPAVERLEFREAGSPFEARLDEISLLDALRPAGNRHGVRSDRLLHLRLEREGVARLALADGPALDGALLVGPVGRRASAEAVARALRQAYGLRSCKAARPDETGCLEGRLGRCLAPCRGAEERVAHAAAADSLADALGGGRVPVDRLRRRRSVLVAGLRFEEAARLRDDEEALREAGARLRRLRMARALHGTVLAPHREPGFVAAFAVAHGLVVHRRALPRSGRADAEVAALAAELDRAVAAGPGPEGPYAVVPARADEAMHVLTAFSRRSSLVAAVPLQAGTAGIRAALALQFQA